MVTKYLNAGVDPNEDLLSVIPLLDDAKAAGDDDVKATLGRSRSGKPPTMLHVAVINCYHRSREDNGQTALKILSSLLKHGADPSAVATNLVLTNIQGYRSKRFSFADRTASGLALFLKKFPWSVYEDETANMLEQVIEIIEGTTTTPEQPHTRILKSTADLYEKLLFSESFSDIRFVCNDGVEIPAHRCILVTTSDYFKRSLQGPWSESTVDGKWSTAHSSKIMKAVLAFIYRGRIQNNLDPLELFSVAAEYDIPSLKAMAENRCIQSLTCENVKTFLQEAHLHRNKPLKKACFSFIRNKAAQVLTDPDMMNLATEDAELWDQLTKAIAPGSSKKRAREN